MRVKNQYKGQLSFMNKRYARPAKDMGVGTGWKKNCVKTEPEKGFLAQTVWGKRAAHFKLAN
jgi:hypothetical protein